MQILHLKFSKVDKNQLTITMQKVGSPLPRSRFILPHFAFDINRSDMFTVGSKHLVNAFLKRLYTLSEENLVIKSLGFVFTGVCDSQS